MNQIGLLLLVLLVSPLAYAQVGCNVREILNREKASLPTTQLVIDIPAGGSFINPYAEYTTLLVNEVPESTPQSRARILKDSNAMSLVKAKTLVAQVRELMINEISQGRAKSQLSSDQNVMIARLQKLKVEFKSCEGPEGNNDSLAGLITICNGLKHPRLALAALLAHEMGHSVDLCNLGQKQYRKVESSTPFKALAIRRYGSAQPADYLNNLKQISNADSEYFLDTAFYSPDATYAERFERFLPSGLLERVDSGVPLADNPALSSYSCLARNNSLVPPVPQTQRQACSNTAYTETGAQIWAARIVSRYAEQNPPASTLEALGLFAMSANQIGGAKPNIPGFDKEAHMNDIYLSEPGLQRLFSCAPKPNQNCMATFTPGILPALPDHQSTPANTRVESAPRARQSGTSN